MAEFPGVRYAVAPTLRGPAQLGHGGQELVDNPIQPVTVPGTLPLRRMSHPVRFMLGGEPSDVPISNVPSGAAHAAPRRSPTQSQNFQARLRTRNERLARRLDVRRARLRLRKVFAGTTSPRNTTSLETLLTLPKWPS